MSSINEQNDYCRRRMLVIKNEQLRHSLYTFEKRINDFGLEMSLIEVNKADFVCLLYAMLKTIKVKADTKSPETNELIEAIITDLECM